MKRGKAMVQEKIVQASLEDLTSIGQLFEECKSALLRQKIYQWDDQYPNIKFFEMAIKEEAMFLLKIEDNVLGALVMDEWQSPEWVHINWSYKGGRYLIIHSFCVHPEAEGLGNGEKLLQFAESFAKEHGYTGIRLDAFSENERALKFYEKRGYFKTGEVIFPFKPENHQTYYCYEKIFTY